MNGEQSESGYYVAVKSRLQKEMGLLPWTRWDSPISTSSATTEAAAAKIRIEIQRLIRPQFISLLFYQFLGDGSAE